MIELQMSTGSLKALDRALRMARTLVVMPFALNLWQAQNIWYEILRSSSNAPITLDKADQPLWEKSFRELGACLSIDYAAISAQEPAAGV
jgi:hypothetical protein